MYVESCAVLCVAQLVTTRFLYHQGYGTSECISGGIAADIVFAKLVSTSGCGSMCVCGTLFHLHAMCVLEQHACGSQTTTQLYHQRCTFPLCSCCVSALDARTCYKLSLKQQHNAASHVPTQPTKTKTISNHSHKDQSTRNPKYAWCWGSVAAMCAAP